MIHPVLSLMLSLPICIPSFFWVSGSGLAWEALVAVWHLLAIDFLEAAGLQLHFGVDTEAVVLPEHLLALITLPLIGLGRHLLCCSRMKPATDHGRHTTHKLRSNNLHTSARVRDFVNHHGTEATATATHAWTTFGYII